MYVPLEFFSRSFGRVQMQYLSGSFHHESMKVLAEISLKILTVDGQRLQQLRRQLIVSKHRQQDTAGSDGIMLLTHGMIGCMCNDDLNAGSERKLGGQVERPLTRNGTTDRAANQTRSEPLLAQ
jgi:hypothetical protein